MRVRSSVQPRFFSVDMHHNSGFSCLSSEQREHPSEGQSPGGLCCGYFFTLFKKVDLQAVMKAGRWSSGCTFTSFYLRDFCPQADSIRKTGRVLPAGDIVEISSLVGLVTVYFVSLGPTSEMSYRTFLILLFKRGGCVLEDTSRLRIDEVFSLSVGSRFIGCPRANPGRRPPLSVKFWYNPKCHMNYLNNL